MSPKRGDYEAALVLYHRAASVHPQNTSHIVAAKKISSFILSSSSVPKKSPKIQKNSRKQSTSYSLSNLEQQIHEKTTSDLHKNAESFFRCPSSKDPEPPEPPHVDPITSQTFNNLRDSASKALSSLKTAFNTGNFPKSLEIASNLLEMTSSLPDSTYRIAAHRFSALSHLSLARHDEALDHALKMINSARESKDIRLQLRSFAVLGKVHLSFGHLNAAAVGWTDLLKLLKEPVPKSWLLHEIGRCHYEMGNHLKALEVSRRCCNWAEEGDSNKWIYHAKLLAGQALISLGRYPEALEALRCAYNVAMIEGDSGIVGYIGDLMDRVGETLNRSNEKNVLSSRTQIIQTVKNKEINGNEGGGVDEDTCIIDKWKKYVNRNKKKGNEGKIDQLYQCFMENH